MHTTITAIQFQDRFRTEEDCELALAKLRWPDGVRCPNCGHDDAYHLKGRRLFQCTVCRVQTSVTAGTLFHKTRIPLRHWFWMIYEVAQDKGGGSSSRLARQLGMYQKTVWHLLQKIRHAMGRRDEGITLAGVIELDEALIGPHARKTGRPNRNAPTQEASKPRKKRRGPKPPEGTPKKTLTEILVMVESGPTGAGCIAMDILDVPSREAIAEIVDRKVDPSQHFKTDGWHAHWVLRSLGHHLKLKVCSGPAAVVHLPIVHQAIGLLKRFLMGTYHGISARYLHRYLQEFCFRCNRRDNENSIFESVLRACLFAVPMQYAELKL
jgi:transposase-like protein